MIAHHIGAGDIVDSVLVSKLASPRFKTSFGILALEISMRGATLLLLFLGSDPEGSSVRVSLLRSWLLAQRFCASWFAVGTQS